MALVEDEERDPYMLEFTKGAPHVNVFRSFGLKKSPEMPEILVKPSTPLEPIAKFKEPEPEDLESLMLFDSVLETVGNERLVEA